MVTSQSTERNAIVRSKMGLFCLVAALTISSFCSVLLQARPALAKEPQPTLTVRVGAYENPPKIFTDKDGQVRGIFPDILQRIAADEGWRLVYVPGTWEECLQRLESGGIDIMVDVAFSKKRAEKYSFNAETVFINWGVLYTRKDLTIDSFLDLQNRTVAVMKGSIHTEGDEGIKEICSRFDISCRFVEVENYRQVFQLLDSGQADIGVVNRLFGNLYGQDFKLNKSSIIFNPRHLKFAFPKHGRHTAELIEAIDRRLRKLKQDPASVYYRAIDFYLSGANGEGMPPAKRSAGRVALTRREQAWLKEHPLIRVGYDPDFPPLEFLDEQGKYTGIGADYLSLLQQHLGIEFQIVPAIKNWTQTVEMAKARQLDVLPVLTPSRERSEYLEFTRPYINYTRVILTRDDFPFIAGLKDLSGKRVGIVAGYYQQDVHEHDGADIKLVQEKSTLDGLKALSAGEVDAFLGDIITSAYTIRKFNLTNLKYAATTEAKMPGFAIGVRSDWPELVSILDKGLNSISEEEHHAIFDKWVSLRFEQTFDYSLLWKIILAFSLVLAMVLWWNRQIRRQKFLIQEAKDAAETANRTKSAFLASMSHELRTPLNSILGFNGIILNEMAGPLNFEQKKQLKMVQGSAKHLLNLINDVLDISKIEAGELEISHAPFNMRNVVEQVRGELLPLAEKKQLTLTAEIAPEVGGVSSDERRIRQVLINLVNNAIKFTDRGGVKIECRVSGDYIETRVSDTGIGIRGTDLHKLFQPFQQLDTGTSRKYEGTGLGLSICKRIMAAVGGRIEVESHFGAGSTFAFSLPLTQENNDDGPNRSGD